MKILVAVKQIATLEEDFEIRPDGKDVDPDYLAHDLNEWDAFSLEEAVRIKEGGTNVEIVALTVGPEGADAVLRKCLAKGADRAVRVWDEAIEGSDSIAIARIIAAAVHREQADLVFAGVQSSDQSFASTGVAVAGFLNWPHAVPRVSTASQPTYLESLSKRTAGSQQGPATARTSTSRLTSRATPPSSWPCGRTCSSPRSRRGCP